MRPSNAWLACALLVAAGCHDPVTEVVVVVDTNLAVPTDFELLTLEISPASQHIQRESYDLGSPNAPAFPLTLGLVPGGVPGDEPFDVTAALLHREGSSTTIVVQRKATGVRFVKGATRALTLFFPSACACHGTNCPNPALSECNDLVAPTLPPFDGKHIPRLMPTDGGTLDARGELDASTDVAADLGVDQAPEVGVPDAPSDASQDAPSDAAPEAPAKLPRGHACGAKAECEDGFCVDGVCCESACTCGTCNATPGTCARAAAGTDPHGDCGSFTCNGAGACETACPESFGACSTRCASGAHCDGAGKCVPSTTEAGYFCVVGSCMCKPGLTCPAPDGGGAGAGKCQ